MDPYIQYMYSYPHKTAYGPLTGIRWEDYAGRLSGRENSLYIHIPFCQSKCGYCNLFSVAGQGEDLMEQYVGAMERQGAQWSSALHARTVFADLTLGGGTPLLLPERLLERVFRIASDAMGFEEQGHPVIVETSPGQTTEEKLLLLKEHHVTRISMGVQSFYGEELKAIHRNHTPEQVERALERIRGVGFACVNLDLIYGIPGQTWESLLKSADRAISFGPEELFVYPLYIKPDTYLYKKGVRRPADTYGMYLGIRQYLREHGYIPYSMRRFVREDYAGSNAGNATGGATEDMGDDCGNGGGRSASCGFGNTVSIGCGGRSYIDHLHFCTPYAVRHSECMANLRQYMDELDYREIRHGYLLSEGEQRRRFVIKNVLFDCGISKEDYAAYFSRDLEADFPVLREWIARGHAFEKEGVIRLTEEGFSLSDHLGPMLISGSSGRDMPSEKSMSSGENVPPRAEGDG